MRLRHSKPSNALCNCKGFQAGAKKRTRLSFRSSAAEELVNYRKFAGYWTANQFADQDGLTRKIYKLKAHKTPTWTTGHDPLRGAAVEIEDSADGWMLLSAYCCRFSGIDLTSG